MTCSPEQLKANQQNAQKSCGPKTPEGKAASRANGLKHGMTGQGIVLPHEDAAEVDRRTARLAAEMNPRTERGAILVHRMAVHSVRMERAVLEETAALTVKILEAQAAVDARGIADPAEAARARHEAGVLASFDPSKEAQLARRYEATAERGFYKAMKEFDKVEAETTADATQEKAKVLGELASSLRASVRAIEQPPKSTPAPKLVPLPIAEPAPAEPAWMTRRPNYPKLPNDLSNYSALSPGRS